MSKPVHSSDSATFDPTTVDFSPLYRKIFGITIAGSLIYILLTSFIFNDAFDKYFFHFHLGSFYPYFLILGLVLIGFSSILLIRSYRLGHTSLIILIAAVFLSGSSYVVGFFNFDPTGTVNFRQTRLFQLQVLLQTMSVFLFYLHYELGSHRRLRTGFLSLNILLLWPYSFLNIYYLLTDHYDPDGVLPQVESLTLFMLQTGVIVIFCWLLYNSMQTAQLFFRRSPQSRNAAILQVSGILLLVIGIVFQLIETMVSTFDVWHTPLNTVAILLIALPYLRNPNVIVFSSVNVLLMGVVDQSGRTMYFKPVDESFANDDAVKSTSELFGGLTLAFSSMGKEVARSEKGVDSLQFADRSIIVEYLNPYYLVVIANQSTYFLEREMEEYLKELLESYPQVPKDGSVIPEEIFIQLNKKFFPVIIQM